MSPTTDNNYSRSRARRRRGKGSAGGKAKSCCSILSKIMKPTPLAPRTRVALPGSPPVPRGNSGSGRGSPRSLRGRPGATRASPGSGRRGAAPGPGSPWPAGHPAAPGRAPRPRPPQHSCQWGKGNMASVRSEPPPGGSKRERKGVPNNTERRRAAERRRRRQALLRGARSCSCSSPGEWGGRAEPRAPPPSPAAIKALGRPGGCCWEGWLGRGWAAETWLN